MHDLVFLKNDMKILLLLAFLPGYFALIHFASVGLHVKGGGKVEDTPRFKYVAYATLFVVSATLAVELVGDLFLSGA